MTQIAYKYTSAAPALPDLSVAMPELGEGAALRLGMKDMQALRDNFGDGWFTEAPSRCNSIDVAYIAAVIERAGRFHGEPAPIDIEMHPDVPIATFAQRALDVVFLAVFGRRFEDELRHRLQANAAAAKAEDGDPAEAAAW
ncbi:MAG TPA: hypothetical protein VNX29_07090 [Kaistia sp.]|nr:hypothetical protein [Kaistia sp.]